MKGTRRKLYNISLSKKQIYEIASLADDELSEIIMTQIEKQEEYEEMGKTKAYFKKYYLAHKKEIAKQQKRYHQTSEHYKMYQKKHREYIKKWRKKHKKTQIK